MIAVALGLVCWIATLILVESELTRPFRDWLDRRSHYGTIDYDRAPWYWRKARYFAGCHLCTGTWVALVIAGFTSYRLPDTSGPAGFVMTALLIKAIGHLALILSRIWE